MIKGLGNVKPDTRNDIIEKEHRRGNSGLSGIRKKYLTSAAVKEIIRGIERKMKILSGIATGDFGNRWKVGIKKSGLISDALFGFHERSNAELFHEPELLLHQSFVSMGNGLGCLSQESGKKINVAFESVEFLIHALVE
jgi:hypothetical protein